MSGKKYRVVKKMSIVGVGPQKPDTTAPMDAEELAGRYPRSVSRRYDTLAPYSGTDIDTSYTIEELGPDGVWRPSFRDPRPAECRLR